MSTDCSRNRNSKWILPRVMWAEMLAALWLVCPCPVEPRRARDVRTTQGYARGYYEPDPPHYAFLGMPYAAVRTRFKAPVPPPRWDGIFEATHRIKCHQDRFGDENCLVVNVFAPEGATNQPVLVFVHDGHFQYGWGSHKPPSKLLNQGLIIVTFNYRLGPLGFLCLKIPEAPGNAGLKDQVAALYWVQMNINRFGGDPADVTVYGIGSGAIAVQILLLSGLTKGLLHKVILESGSVLSPMSLEYEPLAKALNNAVKLGYDNSENPEQLVEFFRKLSLKQLRNKTEIFLPCVENSYYYLSNLLEEDPVQILKKQDFQEVPMVIVYSHTDGVSVVENNREAMSSVPKHFDILLPSNLWIANEKKRIRIAEVVKELYFDVYGNEGELHKNYIEYFHDVLYQYPTIKFGVLFAEKSLYPVYLMKFVYMKKNVKAKEKIIDYVYGDVIFPEDNVAADRLIGLLCNFIKLGDPTPITTSTVPVIWKSVVEDLGESASVRTAFILEFNSTLTMTSYRGNQRLSFWDHIYNSFYRTHSMNEDDLE